MVQPDLADGARSGAILGRNDDYRAETRRMAAMTPTTTMTNSFTFLVTRFTFLSFAVTTMTSGQTSEGIAANDESHAVWRCTEVSRCTS